MSRYTLPMENQTIVASATLLFIRSATAWASRGSLLEILRVEVSQNVTSTSQQLGVTLGQKVTAFGTYTATTPTPLVVGAVASAIAGGTAGAAATAGTDASAEGAGAVTTMIPGSFNNLNGYLWVATPEERILIGPDLAFVVKLLGTPTTLTGWSAYLTFEEMT